MKVRIWVQVEQLLGDKFERVINHEEMHEVDVKDVLYKVQDVADAVKSRLADINFVEGKP
jgi:hypothetical protein